MKVFPKGTIGWALWLMHGLETFVLTIFFAVICGIRVEYAIFGENLIRLNCITTLVIFIISFIMLLFNKREAHIGLAIGMVGVAMAFMLLPALNK